MEKKSAWLKYSTQELASVQRLATEYIDFLQAGKTERECVREAVRLAEAAGFVSLETCIKADKALPAGAKVYAVNMQKNIVLFKLGSQPLENGMNIVAAHIDSPRLDIKQNTLYEAGDLAYLDTHYYGGIKKYQWTAMPLALHGVIIKKDGEIIDISLGEKAGEPVFCVTDLLIHLADKQLKQNIGEAVTGEKLDILVGSQPLAGNEKEAVKAGILKLLAEHYSIAEEDFISAELELVPAGSARSMGLDDSMVLGYGQDDRVCAYTALRAMLELTDTAKTAVCLLVDKEEIGSIGATGMQAAFFANTVAELIALQGTASNLAVKRALKNSQALSADVGAAFDSLYSEVFDKKNTSQLGFGVLIKKFTGARGKSGANDANAEYLAAVRKIFDAASITFQTMETGKVDAGGGGTIAYILALYGMEIVDCGVPILNMHAPWEVVSKADVYEALHAYRAFFLNA